MKLHLNIEFSIRIRFEIMDLKCCSFFFVQLDFEFREQDNNGFKWKLCVNTFKYLGRIIFRLWNAVGCVVCVGTFFYTAKIARVRLLYSVPLSWWCWVCPLSLVSLTALFVWWARKIAGFWEGTGCRFFMFFASEEAFLLVPQLYRSSLLFSYVF